MIKMLVSSFFNTIIDEEDAIPTSTMFEIDRIRQKNIKIVLLTNRLEDEVLYYNRDYPFIDYIISLNGGRILDVNNNKSKDYISFTKEEVEEITNKYSKKEILYYTNTNVFDYIPQESVYKIEIKGINKNINSKFNTSIFKRGKDKYLELYKNNYLDTLKSITDINDFIGIIGNDSEEVLLDNVKNIYVVRNASKSLKDKTERITKSNKNKGVEQVIKKEIK